MQPQPVLRQWPPLITFHHIPPLARHFLGNTLHNYFSRGRWCCIHASSYWHRFNFLKCWTTPPIPIALNSDIFDIENILKPADPLGCGFLLSAPLLVVHATLMRVPDTIRMSLDQIIFHPKKFFDLKFCKTKIFFRCKFCLSPKPKHFQT